VRSLQTKASRDVKLNFDEGVIDSIFAEFNQGQLPGVAVGIAINGRPVYRKGFGLANMELPVQLSPTIRMRIASITKHFACLAYLLLCEEGKASLDDPVGKHLPESHPLVHRATMRQLMSNVSGLRDALDLCLTFCGFGNRVSTDEMVALYRNISDVSAPPGSTWLYNNGNWQILTVVIERISGKPLEQFFQERIFAPIGMYQTLLRRVDTDFVAHSAAPHMIGPTGTYEKNERANLFVTALAGEGGIVSTVDDMLRWLAHMDAPIVGTPGSWKGLKTPQILANGTSTGYGFGLISGRYRGARILYHPGGGTGSNAQMVKVLDAGLDLIVMSNRHDVSSVVLTNRILDACLTGLDSPRRPSKVIPVSGVYYSPTTGRVVQFCSEKSVPWTEEGQQLVSIDGMEMHVEPDESGVLWAAGIFEVKQSINVLGQNERPTRIRFSDFGNVEELVIGRSQTSSHARSITGRYRSDATNTELAIYAADESPRLITTGPFGSAEYLFECLAQDVWRARHRTLSFHGGVLTFEADGTACRFSNAYNRSICFRRLN
jgi:D-aminopeptidase